VAGINRLYRRSAVGNKKPHYGWVSGFDGSGHNGEALDNRNPCVMGFTRCITPSKDGLIFISDSYENSTLRKSSASQDWMRLAETLESLSKISQDPKHWDLSSLTFKGKNSWGLESFSKILESLSKVGVGCVQ